MSQQPSLSARLFGAVLARAKVLRRQIASAQLPDPRAMRLKLRLERALEQLKDIQWEIRESETRYRDLLEAQQDIIFRRNADGVLTFVNEAYCRAFGIERAAALGQPFAIQIRTGEIAPSLVGTDRRHQRFAVQLETPNGLKWYDIQEHTVPGQSGKPTETQCVGRDITEQRRTEAELKEARDQAEAANRAKSRFLAAMSHEIRTPMNGILGMAALLEETDLTPEQRTYAGAVQRSGRTLLSLIDEILDFSKIEAGRLDLDEAAFAVEDCVQAVVELLSPRAREKGIELAWAINPDVPRLGLGDEVRLRQIVTNLVGNAVKFTEKGGVLVTVTTDRTTGMIGQTVVPKTGFEGYIRVVIAVKDTGVGISSEAFRSLFAEFEQGDEARRRVHGGTGLGLAISRRLARAMGGDITAQSIPGQGSEFQAVVYLKPHAIANHRSAPQPGAHHVLLALPDGFERTAIRLTLEGAHIAAAEALPTDAAPLLAAAAANDAPMSVVIADGANSLEQNRRLIEAARATAAKSGGDTMVAYVLLDQMPRAGFDAFERAGFDGYLLRPVRPGSLLDRLDSGPSLRRLRQTVATEAEKTLTTKPTFARILLVEDNDINALLARRMLEKCGCHITHVGNGAKAVEAVIASQSSTAKPFDLVLMDVHMPVMDGLEAARRLRARAETSVVPPVIALTANAFAEDRTRCLDAGMQDYLAKPFEKDELDAILAKWVRRAKIAGDAA